MQEKPIFIKNVPTKEKPDPFENDGELKNDFPKNVVKIE